MSTGRFFDRTIPFWGFHGSSEVLQTLLVAPPSWIQDGGAGNDVNQDLGRPFRSPLWRWRKMAALPLPAAILDDLIPGPGNWEWGHPRWRPEAEGPPSCATATMGIEKAALYYWGHMQLINDVGVNAAQSIYDVIIWYWLSTTPCCWTLYEPETHETITSPWWTVIER